MTGFWVEHYNDIVRPGKSFSRESRDKFGLCVDIVDENKTTVNIDLLLFISLRISIFSYIYSTFLWLIHLGMKGVADVAEDSDTAAQVPETSSTVGARLRLPYCLMVRSYIWIAWCAFSLLTVTMINDKMQEATFPILRNW